MYRLCSNASRASHQTWTGTRRRWSTVCPSGRHRCAVPEAAVEGTRAWTALGHRELPKGTTCATPYQEYVFCQEYVLSTPRRFMSQLAIYSHH